MSYVRFRARMCMACWKAAQLALRRVVKTRHRVRYGATIPLSTALTPGDWTVYRENVGNCEVCGGALESQDE